MPDSLAGPRVQGEQTICEEIVADAIGAVEIKSSGARGSVENSALGIERHASPIVGGAASLPGIFWPRVVAEFTGTRNSVKRPAQFAGSNIVSANVAGRCGKSLGVASTENHQVLVNDARAGEIDRLRSGRLAAQIFTEVDAASVSKRGNRFAGGGVQSVDEVHHANENALVFAIGPVCEPAIRLDATNSGVKLPKVLACCGIQRENRS